MNFDPQDYSVNDNDNFFKYIIDNRQKYQERTAYRIYDKGLWISVSWNSFVDNIKRYASAMLNAGIKPGDKVLLFAPNCHEWTEIDYACVAVGAISVAAHANASARSLQDIVAEIQPQLIFVGSPNLAAKMQAIADPERIIVIAGAHPGCRTLYHFAQDADRSDWCDAGLAAKPDALWTIVYTSGTTGDVRGAMLPYRALIHLVKSHRLILPNLNDSDSSFCLLPLSHIFERGWSAIQYVLGMTHHYCSATNKEVFQAIKSAHPSVICVVPRVLEKIYVAFKDQLSQKPRWFRRLLTNALEVGARFAADQSQDKKSSIALTLQHRIYEKLIYTRIRSILGGELKHCVVGSAALSPAVQRFFQAIGIFINNGYGLTETTGTVCYTPLGHSLAGTVGVALPGVEVRLSPDHEIQVKGESVMTGYYNRPQATEAAFTEDGYFRTGDVGEHTENGYLRITDRIKDLLRTSTGQYVAPQRLESLLNMLPYVDQAAVVGEGHSWIGALIVPNLSKLTVKAKALGISSENTSELFRNDPLLTSIQEDIDKLFASEMNHEKVRRFVLIEQPFSTDNDELTPTLKLRRHVINEHYQRLINDMFATA